MTDVYAHALKGFAAAVPAGSLPAIKADPRVVSVAPDRDDSSLRAAKPVPCTDVSACQALGNSVNRIDGESSSTRSGDGAGTVPVNVAVIDSGIDVDHPDLNVVGGANCYGGGDDYDDPLVPNPSSFTGHGIMVAGYIGALDNSIGRVGVAPGARLWALKTSGPQAGTVTTSALICALDFIASTRTDSDPTNDIAVANMSLGGRLFGDEDCARPGTRTASRCVASLGWAS